MDDAGPAGARSSEPLILSGLNTWGWVTLILGCMQIGAGFSLFAGNAYGRWFGIISASLTAIAPPATPSVVATDRP